MENQGLLSEKRTMEEGLAGRAEVYLTSLMGLLMWGWGCAVQWPSTQSQEITPSSVVLLTRPALPVDSVTTHANSHLPAWSPNLPELSQFPSDLTKMKSHSLRVSSSFCYFKSLDSFSLSRSLYLLLHHW